MSARKRGSTGGTPALPGKPTPPRRRAFAPSAKRSGQTRENGGFRRRETLSPVKPRAGRVLQFLPTFRFTVSTPGRQSAASPAGGAE